ncbi:MAG TPA: magnesium/cobalt transporter CorA [Acidimicrobiales bacterium]|nr:magnesium/cobalt transporter CorA [Acidimicrobiales bacterium]
MLEPGIVLKGTLRIDAKDEPATSENVFAALAGTEFFWLDLDDEAQDGTVSELLSVHFKFHPLAVASAEKFNQRPRIDDYDGFMYLVARGADPEHTGRAEVHCFWTDRYVVTVHRGEDCPSLSLVRARMEQHHARDAASPQLVIVYLMMSAEVDSFFPFLSKFDDKIDALEDDILKAPTEEQLGELFDMKRTLMDMRKVIAPQRDMMASINAGVADVPGMTDEASRYFRDLYDHLIRLADLVDNYRDLLSGVMDTHLSTVSNRLNVVMKQLTIIATIFLPLSFLTGFFGQNFAYMVRVWLMPTWSFFVLGIGLELSTVVFLVWIFRKRGWLGGPTV